MADEAASRDQQPTAVEATAADTDAAMAEPIMGTAFLAEDLAAAPSNAVSTPVALTTGTATPFELDPEQAAQSLKVSLADLSAKATALYGHKNYEEATEVFAQAAEMQAEMMGEMHPENAEILFLYGRSLFKVGQSKSDVLGGKAPATDKNKPTAKGKANGASAKKTDHGESSKAGPGPKAQELPSTAERGGADETVKAIAEETSDTKNVEATAEGKKPLFQFTGDENFDYSDEEEVSERIR
jgi:HAT1-interacting factor 1